MASSSSEQEEISSEDQLSVWQECYQELSLYLEFKKQGEAAGAQRAIELIDQQQKHQAAKKELKSPEDFYSSEDTETEEVLPEILDVENLLRCPCRIQCPGCKETIITETISSPGMVAWMLCHLTASLGCLAGCCLIPLFIERFKSVTHKCPLCRTSIKTIEP